MTARVRRILDLQVARFLISGGLVFVVSFSLTAGFDQAGLPFQAAFALAYAIAVALHLQLHRRFTFGDRDEFALGHRSQAVRFAAIVVGQYSFIAISVAVFTPLLHVHELVVYVLAVAAMSLTNFVVIARRVFHGHAPQDRSSEQPDEQRIDSDADEPVPGQSPALAGEVGRSQQR